MTTANTARPAAGGINEAFPAQVCINLDRRPERWQQMQLKFEQHGLHSVRRFPALDGDALDIPAHWLHTTGAYGCLQSHLQVVCEARRLNLSSVLIFEDDVVFDPHLQEIFEIYIEQLPPDWDMLFFGALHKDELIKVSDNVVRLTRSNSTYAYALRETVFDAFIELNRKAADVLDNNNFILQRQFNCYCFMPHVAWVETDYSDAQRRLERHWYLQESLVLFGTGVDRLLSETTIVFAHNEPTQGNGRATANMMFLVNYYSYFFSPHLAIVIVEQGVRPALDPAALPANCKYIFLRDDGPFDREQCFATGIENSEPGKKFLILSDNDIYLETLDIRANLRMCEQYDGAAGFSHIIDLSVEDSLRLLETQTTRGLDITTDASQINNERRGYCCFINNVAVRMSRGRDEEVAEKVRLLLSPQALHEFRIFQSPNHALRLRQD